jgi:hypothetical protein
MLFMEQGEVSRRGFTTKAMPALLSGDLQQSALFQGQLNHSVASFFLATVLNRVRFRPRVSPGYFPGGILPGCSVCGISGAQHNDEPAE